MLTLRGQRDNAAFLTEWWRTVDRYSLFSFLVLTGFGLVLILSVSATEFKKQAIYTIPALCIGCTTSALSLKNARRAGSLVFFASVIGIFLTLTPLGKTAGGASRWIFGMQPSEFLKPGFIIFTAWMLSCALKTDTGKAEKSPSGRSYFIAAGAALAIPLIALICQPDWGQSLLIGALWTILFFAYGANPAWLAGIAGFGALAGFSAYISNNHIYNRVNGFLWRDEDDKQGVAFQAMKSVEAVKEGGFIGKGPGEMSFSKEVEANDLIYAVGAEQFGLLFTLALLIPFGIIIYRALRAAMKSDHDFIRLSCTGLASLFFLQAGIHIAVNLDVFPNKGMTLPFISSGGSSLVSLWFAAGLLLALTRRNPGGTHGL